MKRPTLLTLLAFAFSFSAATTAQACVYIPWLDPLAWLGFYGCGSGCGYGYGGYGGYAPGCCYGGYGGGYSYGYQQPVAPMMSYPVAPAAPACNCTSAVQPQAQMTAVQVPVTTYRAVTQYVPQTTYQTQYRMTQQSAVAYNPVPAYPTTAYNGAFMQPAPLPATAYYAPPAAPMYSSPVIQAAPSVATPVYSGDIMGDHEFPTQSATAPVIVPNSHTGSVPVHRVSYGVTPQGVRSFPASVR